MFRTPSARTGSRLVLNRIDEYAALLARRGGDHASPDMDSTNCCLIGAA